MRPSIKSALILAFILAEATVAAAQSGAPVAGSSQSERLICRRMPETGSLARTRRQCFTRAQWDRLAESEQSGAGRMIDELRTKPGGN